MGVNSVCSKMMERLPVNIVKDLRIIRGMDNVLSALLLVQGKDANS